jgi:uncharacterized membrane protein YczE
MERALIEKLIVAILAKFSLSFMKIRRVNNVSSSAHHWFLSLATEIQSTPSCTVSLRFILILHFDLCLCLRGGLFPSGIPTKFCIYLSYPLGCYMPHPILPDLIVTITPIRRRAQIIQLLIRQILSAFIGLPFSHAHMPSAFSFQSIFCALSV